MPLSQRRDNLESQNDGIEKNDDSGDSDGKPGRDSEVPVSLKRKRPSSVYFPESLESIDRPIRGGARRVYFPVGTNFHGFIYSHTGGRVRVGHDVVSFTAMSLQLLRINPDTDWEFVVEQYDNSPGHKDKPFKPRVVSGAGSFNIISKDDASAWEDIIYPLVVHHGEDWMMAVRPADGTKAPEYLYPAIIDGPGQGKPTRRISRQPGEDLGKPANDNISSANRFGRSFTNPSRNPVYESSDDGSSNEEDNTVQAYLFGDPVPVTDRETFVNAVLDKVQKVASDPFRFSIDRYSRKANRGELKIETSVEVTNDLIHQVVDEEIFEKITDTSRDWTFVARNWTDKPSLPFKPPYLNGRVWGYDGSLWARNNATSILEKALQLLGIAADSDWSFFIDIHGAQISTHRVTKKTWSTFYQQNIRQLVTSESEDWPLFFREGGPQSSKLEPITTIDIVTLIRRGEGTAYWKVPKNILYQEYGINQPQESFFRAMQVLFPEGYTRPACNVLIGRVSGGIDKKNQSEGVDIGFGGMEVTPELWQRVKKDTKSILSKATNDAPRGLWYYVEVIDHAMLDNNVIGIRLVGNHGFAHTVVGDFDRMMSEIIDLGENNVADRHLPTNFRIWRSAEHREALEDGKILRFGERDADIEALEDWFNSSEEPTDCVHYRPEWSTFKLVRSDGEESESLPWDSEKAWTLDRFRGALRKLFQDLKPNFEEQSIDIYDPQSDRRFVLASNTTEKEWRKHAYDWFSTSRLQVRVIPDLKYSKHGFSITSYNILT